MSRRRGRQEAMEQHKDEQVPVDDSMDDGVQGVERGLKQILVEKPPKKSRRTSLPGPEEKKRVEKGSGEPPAGGQSSGSSEQMGEPVPPVVIPMAVDDPEVDDDVDDAQWERMSAKERREWMKQEKKKMVVNAMAEVKYHENVSKLTRGVQWQVADERRLQPLKAQLAQIDNSATANQEKMEKLHETMTALEEAMSQLEDRRVEIQQKIKEEQILVVTAQEVLGDINNFPSKREDKEWVEGLVVRMERLILSGHMWELKPRPQAQPRNTFASVVNAPTQASRQFFPVLPAFMKGEEKPAASPGGSQRVDPYEGSRMPNVVWENGKKKVKCFSCFGYYLAEENHFGYNCPHSTCYICRETGHNARDCPKSESRPSGTQL